MTMMIRPYSSKSITKTSLLSCLIEKVVGAAVPGRKAFSSTTTTAASSHEDTDTIVAKSMVY